MKTMNIKSTDYRVQITESGSVPGSVLAAIRKASVLCTLCSVLLISSCTHDEIIPPTPLAPQGTKTVTVDFQLPEGKPGFEVQSTDNRVQSTDNGVQSTDNRVQSTDNGVQSTDNGVQSTDNRVQSTDNRGQSTGNRGQIAETSAATDGLCTLYSELCTLNTTRSTADWANGDELMMKITVKGFDDTDGYAVYESYMMLAYDQSNSKWDMLEDKSTTVTENSPVANPDYVMLAQTTDIDLTQPLSIKVPEDMSLDGTIVSVTYAPELEWDITPDANGAVTDVNRKLKATATTTAPECWEVSGGEWSTNQARLRVRTGAAGDVVKLTSENFYPNSIEESADGIYTATTQTDGYAYFYGKAGTIDESDNPIALTSGFNLSLTAVTVGEGDAAFTCPIAPVTLLEASTLVPVQLVGGKSYRLDATEKRPDTESFAVIDGTSGDEAAILDAIAAGKTTLYVTGEPVGDIVTAISLYSGAADGTIDLILADATAIGEYAFNECSALTSVELPAATKIGDAAFEGCSALKSVSAPKATSIGVNAFFECTSLASVELPAAETIGDAAFFECTSLTSLTFGSVIETVGTDAFYGVPTTTCDLTLNSDQQYSTGQNLRPDVYNRWAGKTWASIRWSTNSN